MKSLVIYFSQGGNTRYVGQQIAAAAGADVEEIMEEGVDRKGVMGWIKAGGDGMMKRNVKIAKPKFNVDDYELVYVGSPVWGFNLAPAIRTYLTENKLKGKKLALFCTKGSTSHDALFKSILALTEDCQSLGGLAFTETELKDKEKVKETVKAWVGEVTGKI